MLFQIRLKNIYHFQKKRNRITIKFVDIFRFLNRSLAELRYNLPKNQFFHTSKFFSNNDMHLVTRQDVYTYEYTDSWLWLHKVSNQTGTPTQQNANWCCATAIAGQAWEIPHTWINNMNVRRHLPDVLACKRFRSIALRTDTTMEDTVSRMVKTPR